VRAIVERRRREREADPQGFQKMGEPELVDWLHANPKHPEYELGARVLQQKQNARLLVHGLDSQPPKPAMPEERDRLTLDPFHVGVLALFAAVAIGLGAALESVVAGAFGLALVGVLLFVPRARHWLVRGIDRLRD